MTAIGQWFSPGTPVSFTNKTNRHDISEILFESGIKPHDPNPKPNCEGCLLPFNMIPISFQDDPGPFSYYFFFRKSTGHARSKDNFV